MNGKKLRSTAGIAGTVAAAAAGALTVGLVAGVVHNGSANATSSTGTTSTSGTSSTSRDDSSTSGDDSTSSIDSAPQQAQPVGGSHGS